MIFSPHLQSYDIFFSAFPHFSVLKNDKLKAIHSDTNTKGDPTSICPNHCFSLTRVSQWIERDKQFFQNKAHFWYRQLALHPLSITGEKIPICTFCLSLTSLYLTTKFTERKKIDSAANSTLPNLFAFFTSFH